MNMKWFLPILIGSLIGAGCDVGEVPPSGDPLVIDSVAAHGGMTGHLVLDGQTVLVASEVLPIANDSESTGTSSTANGIYDRTEDIRLMLASEAEREVQSDVASPRVRVVTLSSPEGLIYAQHRSDVSTGDTTGIYAGINFGLPENAATDDDVSIWAPIAESFAGRAARAVSSAATELLAEQEQDELLEEDLHALRRTGEWLEESAGIRTATQAGDGFSAKLERRNGSWHANTKHWHNYAYLRAFDGNGHKSGVFSDSEVVMISTNGCWTVTKHWSSSHRAVWRQGASRCD